MSTVLVRRNDVMPAVHSTDADLHDILKGWFREAGAPEEEFDTFLASFDEAIAQHEHKPWLVKAGDGIQFVPPASFLTMFEEIGDTDVLGEIYAERSRHPQLGYDVEHDDAHGAGHLIQEALRQLNPLVAEGNVLPNEARRQDLIKAGALVLAAIDTIDRAEALGTD